jgi:hypothetical protein
MYPINSCGRQLLDQELTQVMTTSGTTDTAEHIKKEVEQMILNCMNL